MELDWPAGSSERRRSSPLDPSRAKGRAWGPCMRIRTLVTPICSSIRLSLPHCCHGDMSGITVSLTPQRKQYSVWALSVGLWGSQSAGPIPHNQGLLTKGSILPEGQLHCWSSIWAHFIPWHFPLVCWCSQIDKYYKRRKRRKEEGRERDRDGGGETGVRREGRRKWEYPPPNMWKNQQEGP